MSESFSPEKDRGRWANYALTAAFFALLWAPIIDSLFHLDHARLTNENRFPAKAPDLKELRFKNLQEFLKSSEMFFNDNFGFRKRLIRYYHRWKVKIFRKGDQRLGIVGKDDWLFYSQEGMLEHYLCHAKFTEEQLRSWQRLLEARRDWLAERGIRYLFIVPPDKHNVYPEKLPDWLKTAAPSHRETKLDQLIAHVKEHSTLQILDLRQTLIEGKTFRPTYLQTDTHWNAFGCFLGARSILKCLSEHFPNLPQLSLEEFKWTSQAVPNGDIARLMGVNTTENNSFILSAESKLKEVPETPIDVLPILNWNMRNAKAVSVKAENSEPLTESVVVFHDSFFAGGFRRFFTPSFKRSVFIWENREFNRGIIEENRPSVVISEVLERFFNIQDPVELWSKEGWR